MKIKSRILKSLTAVVCLMGIAICCLIFQRCQKIDTNFDYKLNIPEEYNEVGKLHNKGLDYVFDAIKEKCIEYTKAVETDPKSAKTIDYATIAKEATINFCKTNSCTRDNFKIYEASVLNSKTNLKSGNIEGINQKQQELFDGIRYVLKTEFSKKNLKKIKEKLDLINLKASKELTEIEAAPIYCATSTTYCTFQYWDKNYKKWYFALHYPEILEQYNDAQLNNLSLKSGMSSLGSKGPGDWMNGAWDTVEGWYNDVSTAVEQWWNEYGEAVLVSDGVGAGYGSFAAVSTAGAGTLVFGPQGLVLLGMGGAITGAVEASSQAVIVIKLIEK